MLNKHPKLYLQSTALAGWHDLVLDAIQKQSTPIEVCLQSYLVLTLDEFMHHKPIASTTLALDLLESLQLNSRQSSQKLHTTGDQCLLLAGFFPHHAHKKNVTPQYFIDIGTQAYTTLAYSPQHLHFDNELFLKLSHHFVSLVAVLNKICQKV